MKRKITALALGALLLLTTVATAVASPHPPTNGGNGAGQSGQCTGPAVDRPSSCQAHK